MSRLSILQWSEDDIISLYNMYELTVDDVERYIKSIQKWMTKQLHLPEIADKEFIIRCLIVNKFRVERVKEKIDAYYTVRTMIPEFYNKNPNSPIINKITNVIYYMPMPNITKQIYQVFVTKLRDPNINNFDAVAFIAQIFNVAEILMREGIAMSAIYVVDLANFKIGHLAKFNPMVMKKVTFVMEKVFGNRLQEIHILNAPNFINTLITLLKNSLKPKLTERIYVHKDIESLHGMISKDFLPIDFGGKEFTLENLSNEWRKVFLEYDDLFRHLQSLKVNEDLRLGKLPFNDIYGVQGNFKQLNKD